MSRFIRLTGEYGPVLVDVYDVRLIQTVPTGVAARWGPGVRDDVVVAESLEQIEALIADAERRT